MCLKFLRFPATAHRSYTVQWCVTHYHFFSYSFSLAIFCSMNAFLTPTHPSTRKLSYSKYLQSASVFCIYVAIATNWNHDSRPNMIHDHDISFFWNYSKIFRLQYFRISFTLLTEWLSFLFQFIFRSTCNIIDETRFGLNGKLLWW